MSLSGCFAPDFGFEFGPIGPDLSGLGPILLMFFLALLLVIGLWIWALVFLYRDAKRVGEDHRVWLAMGILFNFVAWAVYLVLRPSLPRKK